MSGVITDDNGACHRSQGHDGEDSYPHPPRQRMYLRVRRRRNAASAETLRLAFSAVSDRNNSNAYNNSSIKHYETVDGYGMPTRLDPISTTTHTDDMLNGLHPIYPQQQYQQYDQYQHPQQPPMKKPRTTTAVWRRIVTTEDKNNTNLENSGSEFMDSQGRGLLSTSTSTATTTTGPLNSRDNFENKNMKQYRVVDAVLDSQQEDDDDDDDEVSDMNIHNRPKKRRYKLTLLGCNNNNGGDSNDDCDPNNSVRENEDSASDHVLKKKRRTNGQNAKNNNKQYKKKSLMILNPCERLVDDSLQKVFIGEIPIMEHVWFISNDPRLCDYSKTWILWRNMEYGNIFHACALWNDIDTVHELLSSASSSSSSKQHAAIRAMLTMTDQDGNTPQQVAELAGHMDVRDVFVHAQKQYDSSSRKEEGRRGRTGEGPMGDKRDNNSNAHDDNDEDYVFDIFCLEDPVTTTSDIGGAAAHGDRDKDVMLSSDCTEGLSSEAVGNIADSTSDVSLSCLDCELHGGIGYWDDNGQLVLENDTLFLEDGGGANDDEKNDDDEDSNDEDWGGNDYPEDEDNFNHDAINVYDQYYVDDEEEDYSNDSDEGPNMHAGGQRGRTGRSSRKYNDRFSNVHEDGEYGGMFDAAYGIYEQQQQDEYDSEI